MTTSSADPRPLGRDLPPGWPEPPADWSPHPGWKPNPSWSPPPDGWWLWLTDDEGNPAWEPTPVTLSPADPALSPADPSPPVSSMPPATPTPAPPRRAPVAPAISQLEQWTSSNHEGEPPDTRARASRPKARADANVGADIFAPAAQVPGSFSARNGLGTAALVLGILAAVLGFIPFIFVISYVLAPLAIIFGSIGIHRVSRHVADNRGSAVAGLVLGIVGLLGAILWSAAFNNAANDISKSLPRTTVSTAPSVTGPESAPSSEPTSSAPVDLPLGQSVTFTESGNNTQVTVLQQRRIGGDLGILVNYTCMTGTCSYNPLDWTLRNTAGTEYEQSFNSDEFGMSLQSGQLNTDAKAQGWIAFSAPPDTYTAEYTGNIFSGAPATWLLP